MGPNKEGWVVSTNFLKCVGVGGRVGGGGVHNKVIFGASYNFIGKMSGFELGRVCKL